MAKYVSPDRPKMSELDSRSNVIENLLILLLTDMACFNASLIEDGVSQ
jgi:hypothetical protein